MTEANTESNTEILEEVQPVNEKSPLVPTKEIQTEVKPEPQPEIQLEEPNQIIVDPLIAGEVNVIEPETGASDSATDQIVESEEDKEMKLKRRNIIENNISLFFPPN